MSYKYRPNRNILLDLHVYTSTNSLQYIVYSIPETIKAASLIVNFYSASV